MTRSLFNPRHWSLLTQFTLLGSLITLLIAVGLAIMLSRQIEERTLDQAALNAVEEASILIAPLLRPSDLEGILPAERYREIDRALRPLLNRQNVVRVKVWNANRTLVYHSDLPDLVGQAYPDNPELEKALQGRVMATISHLSKEENRFERGVFPELLEVYAPVHLPGSDEVLGAYEFYSDLAPLRRQISESQRIIWAAVALGFAVLFLSLFGVVSNANRRLIAQATENTRLAAAAERASALEALNQLKSEFVSTVAHELRTPLTYLQGYSELLLNRPGVTPAQRERWLRVMHDETRRLSALITDLLDLSRIEQGRMKVEPSAVDLPAFVRERLALFEVQTTIHHLRAESEENLPPAWVDRQMLARILDNLLSNAIKYSPSGGEIAVRVARSAMGLQVSVRDQGLGIAADELTRVFDRFHRVDSEVTRKIGGFGLGLAIVKSSVELSGGQIWVESTPGKGSTFYFTLPIAPTAQVAENAVACPAR